MKNFFPKPSHRYAKTIELCRGGKCSKRDIQDASLRTFAVHVTYAVGIGEETPNDAMRDSRH